MRRILIVDDEPSFTSIVKLNLEATGQYEVFMENRGSQALMTAVECKPDLVLLDVIMPDMEGPEVLYEFRNDERVRNIPVVFLTATVTPKEAHADNGVIGGRVFLAKPGTIGELVDCIEKYLPATG
ncbi:MAG: response regulator [Candidatus Omnitrophota bacterium]|nr:response regulator [Candidatus Omnitrophota bacterium]MDZ4242449.1 response regulator [Candidatus Omnitrophota bacterium]